MIVLDEPVGDSGIFKLLRRVGFKKKTAMVAEYFRFDFNQAVDSGFNEFYDSFLLRDSGRLF